MLALVASGAVVAIIVARLTDESTAASSLYPALSLYHMSLLAVSSLLAHGVASISSGDTGFDI